MIVVEIQTPEPTQTDRAAWRNITHVEHSVGDTINRLLCSLLVGTDSFSARSVGQNKRLLCGQWDEHPYMEDFIAIGIFKVAGFPTL